MKSIAVATCVNVATSEDGTQKIGAGNTVTLTSYSQEGMLRSR